MAVHILLASIHLSLVALASSRVRITEHPSSVSVPEGAPATLHCRTSPPTPVVWEREGVEVATREDHLSLPDGSLFLLSTTVRDAGTYTCLVREEGREVRSREARVEVRFLRHTFGQVARVVRVVEGEVARVACLPPRGSPRPSVRWEREGEEVEGRVEDKALVLDSVRVEDGGLYTCVASSTEGEVRDEVVEVEVVPMVSSTHEVILVERGEEELSLKVWVVAIVLAVTVTMVLMAITMVVCLRYRRLAIPTEVVDAVGSEQGSTSSYSSGHRLLFARGEEHHYASSPVVRGEYRSAGRSAGEYRGAGGRGEYRPGNKQEFNQIMKQEYSPNKKQEYNPTKQEYNPMKQEYNPTMKQEYSRPFNYVVMGRSEEGEYDAPHLYS